MSLRQQICDILATGCFTVVDVADSLGVQSRAGIKRVRDAIWLLAKEGRVAYVPGTVPKVWRLAEPKVSVQQRLWRACVLKSQKGPFTAADLVPIVQGEKSAAVSRDYATRYVRWLWASAYLMLVGQGRNKEQIYRVIPERDWETPPHWNRRAEKRKIVGQASPPAVLPASGQEECTDWNPQAGCMGTPQACPGPCPHMEEETGRSVIQVPEELQKFAASMRQAYADFIQGLRKMAPYFPQIKPVLLEMEADLARAAQEQGHGEPEGHH